MTTRLQQRRDTAANWTSNNPTLAAGEIGYETDTKKFKIGDGSTAWTSLAYAYGAAPALSIPAAQTGTSYTLQASDAGSLVTLSNSGSITVTVPPSVFSAGQVIDIQQIAAGQVTLSAGSGVTITSTGSTASAPKLRVQYSGASIVCTASNTFTVFGDIA
jgi:Major tropism determinant N-terminal domain